MKLRNLLSSSSGGSSNITKANKTAPSRDDTDHRREHYDYYNETPVSPDHSKNRSSSRGRASSVGRALRNGLSRRGRSKSQSRDNKRRSKSLGREAQREVLNMDTLLRETAGFIEANHSKHTVPREIRAESAFRGEHRNHEQFERMDRSDGYSIGDDYIDEENDQDDDLYRFRDDHSATSSRASKRKKKKQDRKSSASSSSYYKHNSQSFDADQEDKHTEKPRKSKMEKIRQLQAKNELYKEEFRRVQKDRKQLKLDLETKKSEVKTLQQEVDQHIEQTAILKAKLSEALQKANSLGENRFDLLQFKQERADTRLELEQAGDRLTEATRRIRDLRDTLRDKERDIDHLKQELEEQYSIAETLRADNDRLRQECHQSIFTQRSGVEDANQINQLEEENNRLNSQLGSTLERAAVMVKEREDAISDLLKENDELKALLNEYNSENRKQQSSVSDEELQQLKKEIKETAKALEASEDRNMLFEEELEAWMKRGNEMEAEIKRMSDQVAKMERALSAAESQAKATEVSARNAREEAAEARALLQEAEHRHHREFSALQSKYNTAQIDVLKSQEAAESAMERAERAEQRAVQAERRLAQSESFGASSHSSRSQEGASNEGNDPQTQQSLMLQQALERKKKLDDSKRSSSNLRWPFGGPAEELTEEQKRIKEIEEINSNQEEEIKQLKSELVRLKSAYNEAMYINGKRIEQLQKQNTEYEERTHQLLVELGKKEPQS